tara:strand:- start:235 stop:432 length:198 start_codon:yes stop_codon:yes gene_type:complete
LLVAAAVENDLVHLVLLLQVQVVQVVVAQVAQTQQELLVQRIQVAVAAARGLVLQPQVAQVALEL